MDSSQARQLIKEHREEEEECILPIPLYYQL